MSRVNKIKLAFLFSCDSPTKHQFMRQIKIRIKGKSATGYEINLPKANLVLAVAEKGFICCGYLDLNTAEKLEEAAAMVRGVNTIEDLLNAKIAELTPQAAALGIKIGMSGQAALELML